MKQLYHVLSMFAISMAVATACSSDDALTVVPTDNSPGAISFTVSVRGNTTRVYDSYWQAGDAIGVTMSNIAISEGAIAGGGITKYNKQYALAGNADTQSGNFVYAGVGGNANQYLSLRQYTTDTYYFYAYYPYLAGAAEPNTTLPASVNINTTSSYQPDATAADSAHTQREIDFMYATGSIVGDMNISDGANVALHFSHKMAKVSLVVVSDGSFDENEVVNLSINIKNVKTTGTFVPLTGMVNVNNSTGNIGNVTMNKSNVANTWTKSLIIMPQNLTGVDIDVTVRLSDSSTRRFTGTNLDFADLSSGGVMQNINLTLSSTQIMVNSATISDWVEQDTSGNLAVFPGVDVINNADIQDWGNNGSGGLVVK